MNANIYVAPQIEVIEIQIEDAVLAASTAGSNDVEYLNKGISFGTATF